MCEDRIYRVYGRGISAMPATKNKRPQVQHIWCPACGCDVKHLVTEDIATRVAAVRARERQVQQAVKYLRSVVNDMELHAQAKPDVQRSLPEIYREWSDELLGEVALRFPPHADT